MRPVLPTILVGVAIVVACTGSTAPPPVTVTPEDTGAPDGDDTFDGATDDTDLPPVDTDPPSTFECDSPDGPGLSTVCDWSVNEAEVTWSAQDGLRMSTRVSPATPRGAYNGQGTGNRAIAGFEHYSRTPVADIDSIVLELEHIVGPNEPPQVIMPEVGMVVDLGCNGDDYAYISVVWQNYPTPDDLGGGVLRYTVFANQPRFTATGGLANPATPGEPDILADPDIPDGAEPGSLADLLGAFPDACLRNQFMGEAGLPFEEDTSGFLLTLGRPTNLQKVEWIVHRVAVAGLDHQ